MKDYLASFYTHFGVLSFKARLEANAALEIKQIATPRELSVACGTALSFRLAKPLDFSELADLDTEAIYEVIDGKYVVVFDQRN
ncbi:MAG: DUF3343 domain-containing protein [Eubacteriales bacterium]|nr:DUF3343 domain-containing protein [Eubacteriales bacterium]